MSQAKIDRDRKLEELKRIKNKMNKPEIHPQRPPNPPILGSPFLKNPQQIIKPEAMPILKESELEPIIKSEQIEVPIQKKEVITTAFPKTSQQDSDNELTTEDLPNIPNPEIEELAISHLKKQLEFLEITESKLVKDLNTISQDNLKLETEKNNFVQSYHELGRMCARLEKELEGEFEKISQKAQKFSRFQSRETNSLEIQDIEDEIQFICMEIEEKDQEIVRLTDCINKAKQESINLASLMTTEVHSSQPEPPSPTYLGANLQGNRRLLSDVGSTGAWAAHQKSLEENKTHFASPDPFESLFPQSTGETLQHNKEEPATPPNEYSQSFEERKFENEEEKIEVIRKKAQPKNTNFYMS